MPRTYRSLIGTILMVLFVIVYALAVMLISPLLLRAASESVAPAAFQVVQVLYYVVAGLGWTLPLLPLIRWMNRPDRPAVSSHRASGQR